MPGTQMQYKWPTRRELAQGKALELVEPALVSKAKYMATGGIPLGLAGGLLAGYSGGPFGSPGFLRRGGLGLLAGGALGAGLGAAAHSAQKKKLEEMAQQADWLPGQGPTLGETDMAKTSALTAYVEFINKTAAAEEVQKPSADYRGMVGGAMIGSLAGLPPGMGAILGARLRSGRGHGLGAAVADLKNSRRKKTAAFEAYQAMLKRAEGEESDPEMEAKIQEVLNQHLPKVQAAVRGDSPATGDVDPRHPALRGMSRGIGIGALAGGLGGAGLGALNGALVNGGEKTNIISQLLSRGFQGAGLGAGLGGGIGALTGAGKKTREDWHASMKQREKTSAFEAYQVLLQNAPR